MHKILVIFICLFIYVTGFAQTKKNVKSEELFKAVESNDENALIKLLKTGADPSVKDNKGYNLCTMQQGDKNIDLANCWFLQN